MAYELVEILFNLENNQLKLFKLENNQLKLFKDRRPSNRP